MNNNFNYKNIDLQIFLQGVAGNDIYNANRIWQEGMSVPQNQIAKVKDRWTGEGTSNSIPRAIYGDPNQNARHSTRFVEDGSYLRIKNVTLGYTLPKEVTQKFHTDMLRIYLSCQNLYTFTKYSGMDPEVGTGGVDGGTYPITRTVSFGLNVRKYALPARRTLAWSLKYSACWSATPATCAKAAPACPTTTAPRAPH